MATLLTTIAVAGCLSENPEHTGENVLVEGGAYYDEEAQRFVQQLGTNLVLRWAPGSISTITSAPTGNAVVTVPFGWLEIDGPRDGPQSFSIPGEAFEFGRQQVRTFLAPPNTNPAPFIIDGEIWNLTQPGLGVDPEDELISGENVWELSAYQEANFPHREPCHPDGNYGKSIDYFSKFFRNLGMEVEVDPYGTQAATEVTGCQNALGPTGPESVANIVATLPGTDPDAPTIFVAGGHYDMVPATTHAAFDDTSGTVATLELARMMSQYEWKHTLKFGLWGGEENGIAGSQFWIQTHPEARNTITTYWNLDVVGMSWPAPLHQPDPIIIAAGPDAPADTQGGAAGPMSDELLKFAKELQTDWFGYPDAEDDTQLWYYEGVASGQAGTAGTDNPSGDGQTVEGGYADVNAQSDHTPFMAAGIPAFFIFNGDALAADNPIGIHNERDSLENMTRYAFFGGEETLQIMTVESDEGEKYTWNPEEYAAAKDALADSWEVVMGFPFYSTVLQDLGYWYAPGTAGQAEANAAEPTA
jgi:hypothetical protein